MIGDGPSAGQPLYDGACTPPERQGSQSKILIVGGERRFRADLARLLEGRHTCVHVSRLDDAKAAAARHRYDLVLLNPDLPDGDGLDLAQHLLVTMPFAKMVVFTASSSFRVALRALRLGALDFIRTPTEPAEIVDRIDAALARSQHERDRELRIRRLHRICQELNLAREEISDQVDMLCNDLAVAYEELNEQVKDVAMASEFRALLSQELDVEDLLRTTLEYLLNKTGPTNAAVFLPDHQQQYSLGAYVNYDCPRESIDRLLDHLCDAICPQMETEAELVAFDDADEFAEWIGMGDGLLSKSQVIAFACMHEDECLAVVVLFRSATTPFEPELAGTLDILRLIFAEQLSRIIRIHHRAEPSWPIDAHEDDVDFDDEFGFGFGGGLAA